MARPAMICDAVESTEVVEIGASAPMVDKNCKQGTSSSNLSWADDSRETNGSIEVVCAKGKDRDHGIHTSEQLDGDVGGRSRLGVRSSTRSPFRGNAVVVEEDRGRVKRLVGRFYAASLPFPLGGASSG